MSAFFVRRPIVAIVIAILMTIGGAVAALDLPIAQFPNIAPPVIQLSATYTGADAQTVQESVATPIEQQMSGVEGMTYMYSINANTGSMTLYVNFDLATEPNIDQVLTQMRFSQAQSQLPFEVQQQGVTIRQSTTSPLALFSVYSPDESYDALFLANYAYINIYEPMSRVPGIGQVAIFGAAQYAMRFWVSPDVLARYQITVPEIILAIQEQNKVNPAGQLGAEPVPQGQEFTYAVRAQGRLKSPEDFGDIVVRANPDGSLVRMRDVSRIDLGAQLYQMKGRLSGKPAAIVAVYQSPGSNGLQTIKAARELMDSLAERFPAGLAYEVSLDTTLAVSEGIKEIVKTLFEALVLVLLVVFVFLQGWRATLIPLLAVPVSLIGTFILFPALGFSINTLSLFGLVLAIGLVVDDAIVVVEAVEHHIENGLSPREATLLAMRQVTGPVIATALIMAAVFVPTAFIPGITGQLYQQFAITIAVSVAFSAFNALTLSPALSALLLRPRVPVGGPLGTFFRAFDKGFGRVRDIYVAGCRWLIQHSRATLLALLAGTLLIVPLSASIPGGFLPDEDQGYFYLNVQLPDASSLQRTDQTAKEIEAILAQTPGVQSYNTVVGFSLLSQVNTTYNAFFFVTLKPWAERDPLGLTANAIQGRLNLELLGMPGAQAFAFSPPAIPGVGTSGGITFMLEDRSGKTFDFLAENTAKFMAAAEARPEFSTLMTTLLPGVPQLFANVDRDKVLKLGVSLSDLYKVLQAYLGGAFVNYFNEFGRVWQVYVQAEGEYRRDTRRMGEFFVRNSSGGMVPLTTLVTIEPGFGPEFATRFNGYNAAQVTGVLAAGYSTGQGMAALQEVFKQTMPTEMGFDYSGMSYEEEKAAQGVSPALIFGFSLLVVLLILAAQYESWTLPFSVLMGVPVAVVGAFLGLLVRGYVNDVYAQIGLVMLIGLTAKNAILIVEFAKIEVEEGKPLIEAALGAARLRIRPILMTAFAFILGTVPLAMAQGAGAISRRTLGTMVISGMLGATLIAVFLVPVSFYVVERFGGAGTKPTPGGTDEGGAPGPALEGEGGA